MRILAYCLMLNHIHLVCVPESKEALAICLRRTHGRYAQYLNARLLRSGHLWQNRFYSCALDERHLWTALRYVELNPVRAGLVANATCYRYSSAAAQLGNKNAFKLVDMEFWSESGAGSTWAESLQVDEGEEERRRIRRATYSGKPLGSDAFIEQCQRLKQALESNEFVQSTMIWRSASLGWGALLGGMPCAFTLAADFIHCPVKAA